MIRVLISLNLSMPYSSESPEWRFLHEVAKLLAPHLARYQPSARNWQDSTTNRQNEALERSLREAFLIRTEKIHFEKESFELFRHNLDQLCGFLDEGVNPVITTVSGTNRRYPYLSGLVSFLEMFDLGLFNLVSGPDLNLFVFTDDIKTKCLTVTRECNSLVTKGLFKGSRNRT